MRHQPATDEAATYAAERAAAVDAGAREDEDAMDVYAALLEAGSMPAIQVLALAALRLPPGDPEWKSKAATLLLRAGGLTCKRRKHASQLIGKWATGKLPVPLHCWQILANRLPASGLKERLALIGGAK